MINTNIMLQEDARWLVLQGGRPSGEFEGVAKKIDLRQSDWSKFWKDINAKLSGIKLDEEAEKKTCEINGKEKELTNEEFEFVRFTLGDPEKISNCCGCEVIQGICQDCYEHCETVYLFS